MPQIGRYVGGQQFVIVEAGLQISATNVPSAEVDGTWRHGMEQVALSRVTSPLPSSIGPSTQGYDGRVFTTGGGGIDYAHALNVDPGATGVPLAIAAPTQIIKSVSLASPTSNPRGALQYQTVVHFVAAAPATDSLPPPLGAPSIVSKFVKTDIDFTKLPALTVPSGAPSPVTLRNRLRWHQSMQMPNRSPGDWYTNVFSEASYASESASERASAALMMCCDLTSYGGNLKEELAIQFVIMGQNVLEAAKAGAVYNFNTGLGGILSGHKLPLLIAAILTDDVEMLEYCDRAQHDIFAEDRQTVYVSADDVATYDYIADDLNMPEWQINPVKNPTAKSRSVSVSGYRSIFRTHHYGQAAVAHILTGGVAAWNHAPFFDYAERTARRTFFKDGASELAWGFASGSNVAPEFHKTMYLAHVTPGWDWPA